MPDATAVLTPDQLRDHWQGHRRLTRRVIEAFPSDDAFATFTIGGMRPFADMVTEFLRMAVPITRGLATGEWEPWAGGNDEGPRTRPEALRLWDEATTELDRLWPTIPAERFQEVVTAFGQWTGPGYWQITYAIDNEVHHRGQAYVYLRALGAEPPAFYER